MPDQEPESQGTSPISFTLGGRIMRRVSKEAEGTHIPYCRMRKKGQLFNEGTQDLLIPAGSPRWEQSVRESAHAQRLISPIVWVRVTAFIGFFAYKSLPPGSVEEWWAQLRDPWLKWRQSCRHLAGPEGQTAPKETRCGNKL